MTFRIRRERESSVITSAPPLPKAPTLVEQLKMQLDDLDAIIKAKMRERNELSEHIMWVSLTPDAEAKMRAIWERIKPR